MDLALNNLQKLICHKTQTNQTKSMTDEHLKSFLRLVTNSYCPNYAVVSDPIRCSSSEQVSEHKCIQPYYTIWIWFLCLMVYQSSWVIKCQNHICWTAVVLINPHLVSLVSRRCPWCSRYRRRKWTRRYEFKSWTRLIAFHIALIPLGKVWIQLFSLQLWVNSRTD